MTQGEETRLVFLKAEGKVLGERERGLKMLEKEAIIQPCHNCVLRAVVLLQAVGVECRLRHQFPNKASIKSCVL